MKATTETIFRSLGKQLLLWIGIGLLCGCALEKTSTRTVKSDCGSTEKLEAFKTTLYGVATNSCANCHGQTQPPLFASATASIAQKEALKVSDFENPSISRLVVRSQDGHCGNNCKTDGSELTAAIASWKESLAQAEANTQCAAGETTPTDEGDDDDTDNPPAKEFGADELNPRTIIAQGVSLNGIVVSQGNADGNWTLLTIPLPGVSGQMTIEAQRFTTRNGVDSGSYRFRRPRIIASGSPILVVGIALSINNAKTNVDLTYNSVETAVEPVTNGNFAPLLSPSPTNPIVQDQDSGDQLVVSFEDLRTTETVNCKNVALFQSNVQSFINSNCSGCHSANGVGNQQRGLNFTGSAELVCRRALQRSNVNSPISSALIQYPAYGASGHTTINNVPIANFIQWIESERP